MWTELFAILMTIYSLGCVCKWVMEYFRLQYLLNKQLEEHWDKVTGRNG